MTERAFSIDGQEWTVSIAGRYTAYERDEFAVVFARRDEFGKKVRRVSRFSLTFRTVAIPTMLRRLEGAGFRVDAILVDYQGGPLRLESDAWIILATRS